MEGLRAPGTGEDRIAVSDADAPRIVIKPGQRLRVEDLKEVWRYRELLYFLIWRDIKVRYKQTLLGVAWALLQPVFTMLVFSIFFGGLAGVPSDGIPYPIFALAGLVPWTYFAFSITQSANSLVGSSALITKVYFPRIIIPIASTLGGIPDLLLAFGVLLIMMPFFGITPDLSVLLLPALLALLLILGVGVGLWLAALNVRYRDVRHTTAFMVQLWLFITPIAYPSSLLSERWQLVYALNPMVGIVEGFRWAVLGTPQPAWSMLTVSLCIGLLVLLVGFLYFRSVEKSFADVV